MVRTTISIMSLLEQIEQYKLDSELIIVEWNPPMDAPLLKDVLPFPTELEFCSIRDIVVPEAVHLKFKNSDKMGMYFSAAVNCGIRRARGEFVLPRPIDSIYSNELVALLATKKLKEGLIYCVPRCDVNRNVVACKPLDSQLAYCRENVLKVNTTQPVRVKWNKRNKLPQLHTMASGDFQLMSRRDWHVLRGYREQDDIASPYVDGILAYAAYASGIKEIMLEDMPTYHIDHNSKFNHRIVREKLPLENWFALPIAPAPLRRKAFGLYRFMLNRLGYRMKSRMNGVPTIDYDDYRNLCREMVSGKRSFILNDENWGLGGEHLEEFIINCASWDGKYERN